jgi:hypothetical protein
VEDILEMVQVVELHFLMELMDLLLTEDLVDLEAADLEHLEAEVLAEAAEDILAEVLVKLVLEEAAEAAAQVL